MNNQSDLHNKWLDLLQKEIGVQYSNLLLNSVLIEDLTNRIEADSKIIEALKIRIKEAEFSNTELKKTINAYRKNTDD